MEDITIGQIAGWLALIAGIISSCTVIWKFVSARHAKVLEEALAKAVKPIMEQQAALEDKVNTISADLHQNNLETARVDLLSAIKHAPHEHQSILQLAEHYFLDLKGDVWMSGIFRKWAEDEKVDISYIVARAAHLKD